MIFPDRFEQITEALKPLCNITKKEFTGLEGEQVPLDLAMYNGDKVGEPGEVSYVRYGKTALLDSRLRNNGYLNSFYGNIIWLHNFQSILNEQYAHHLYTGPTSYLLQSLDLANAHVLELGAADGIQSLVAIKNGAAKSTAVEIDPNWKRVFQAHVGENDFDPEQFKYITGNIEDPDLFKKLPVEEVDIVVANIGPAYGSAHFAAINLLDQLPNARFFIGGGYVKGSKRDNPTHALEQLAWHGFATNFRRVLSSKSIFSFIVERNTT